MEEMRFRIIWLWLKRHSEVIPQRIDQNDDRFVEALGMPASLLYRSRRVSILELDGRSGAFGSVLEDEAGE